jgi:oligopeptide transport system ATP-binding protein
MPSIRATAEPPAAPALLSLERLSVSFLTPHGPVAAVRELSVSVARGECLGVVGESGAGKSQAFLAILGLLAANGRCAGSARFDGEELLGLPAAALDRVRGGCIGLVFQDPMTSLTPHVTVGAQIAEVLVRHRGATRAAARARALELLERVHVSDAPARLGHYPHQLSGGMRQRVMIAIALAGGPRLLILDEPTTSLDVTIQAQILALLLELKRAEGLAMVLITHDLGAVAGIADRIAVMRGGALIEEGAAARLFKSPREPYTRALLDAARLLEGPAAAHTPAPGAAALTLADVRVSFALGERLLGRRPRFTALAGVGFEVGAGESLGIVGESGSGKTTLVRAALQLLPCSGRVLWMGRSLGELPPPELRALRRELQLIFQDPLGSLDPRLTVAQIVAEPLGVHARELAAAQRAAAVASALQRVGLSAALGQRYPHELSGGQAQRVGIARAMILKPKLLVCDEPLSALDVPTQEQIVTLLAQLRRESGLSLLFVSHNLALVRRLCERVLVLYLGRMMELAPAGALFERARHPYTRALLAAVPVPDPDLQPARLLHAASGEPPSARSPPSGCVYRTRCPHALPLCAAQVPAWEEAGQGARVACHRWRELP